MRGGRRPFADLDVVAYTYDMSAATLRLARLRKCPAVLPRGLGLAYAQEGDRVSAVPLPGRLTLFMVTRRPAPHELTAVVKPLPGRLGLHRPPARRPGESAPPSSSAPERASPPV
ncbi:hypothetical protein JOL79_23445 [Microbispora sp. RL4-1S]|uniref:Uncharacterized protein n=1 Tax=Microbispora oryzae TaxID=2806554 RepID=A0A941AK14_9ACTN|nr:hypothetical protein [Microbispora oryzae]MBP2706766.1 hypothetical protein [Microbispora oryzae]